MDVVGLNFKEDVDRISYLTFKNDTHKELVSQWEQDGGERHPAVWDAIICTTLYRWRLWEKNRQVRGSQLMSIMFVVKNIWVKKFPLSPRNVNYGSMVTIFVARSNLTQEICIWGDFTLMRSVTTITIKCTKAFSLCYIRKKMVAHVCALAMYTCDNNCTCSAFLDHNCNKCCNLISSARYLNSKLPVIVHTFTLPSLTWVRHIDLPVF